VLPNWPGYSTTSAGSRDTVFTQVETIVEAHPLHAVLTSFPADGVGTGTRILTEIVGRDFASAGLLASYAGPRPRTWTTSTSIRGDHTSLEKETRSSTGPCSSLPSPR
jgi:hypothetical protein